MNQEFINDLERFIAIPSKTLDPHQLLEATHFIKEYFDETTSHIEEFECERIPSIVVSNRQTRAFDFVLSGHFDVVDAPKELFDLKIQDDTMLGRGTADMKAYVLAMMAVYKELTEANALNYSVALMLTGDEERGGFHGARHLLEDEGYTSRLAHIPDGGKKINVIEIENKGFRNLHLRSYGEPAHGSRPWLGKNAIDQLMDALVEIRQLFAEPDPNIWQTTCTLSTIKGGDAVNAVPDHAEASLDIRFPGTVDDEALEKQIRAITDKYNIEVTHNGTGAALHIDVESPVVKRYEQAIAKFSDKPIEYYRSEAGSDARFFAQQGIPVIVHQADCGGLHTNDEWLSLSSLEMYMNILREYMLSLNDVFAK